MNVARFLRAHRIALAFGFSLAALHGALAQTESDLIAAVSTKASGVTGSGETMVLHIPGIEGTSSILRLGDTYGDGWVLSTLSPSAATFTRQKVTVKIGLNPSGQLPSAVSAAPSSVIAAGSLGDTMQRFTSVGVDTQAKDGSKGIRLGGGPGPPMIKIGEKLTDGWTLVAINGFGEAIFERNGEYRAVGPDAGNHIVLGLPNQVIPPRGAPMLALTPPDLPPDFMQLPDDQRLIFYRELGLKMSIEAQSLYGRYAGDWDVAEALGLALFVDRSNLMDAASRRNSGALVLVGATQITNPNIGLPVSVVSGVVNSDTGETSRIVSLGAEGVRAAGTMREALRLSAEQTQPRP